MPIAGFGHTPQFSDCSAVLNTIAEQVTGRASIAPVDTSSFVQVAARVMNSGYDPLATAISTVLSRTIFSVRPYNAKFKGLKRDSAQYGAWNRKLTACDKDFEQDNRLKDANGTLYYDGATIDQYKVNKPVVLETQISGASSYQKSMTIWKDQLDSAFNSVEGFQSFLTMMMQNASDLIEQAHESTARMLLSTLMAVDLLGDEEYENMHRINVLAAYNEETGKSLKVADVYKPENIEGFTKFFYETVNRVSSLMTERSSLYQNKVYGDYLIESGTYSDELIINRHTPLSKQKLYILTPLITKIKTNVFSSIFNPDFLKLVDYEDVNFWQSIKKPDEISVKNAKSLTGTGAEGSGYSGAKQNVLGILFDEEAAGYTTINEWAQATPFNARGGYYNQYWHFTDRYWYDLTEKSVVFYLEDTE